MKSFWQQRWLTWSVVVSVSVEGGRTRDETERRHVRHVRSESAKRGRVLGSARHAPAASSAIRSAATAAAASVAAWHQVGVSAVAGTPALSPIPVDGCLQLVGRAVLFLLALVRIQILHVPVHCKKKRKKAKELETNGQKCKIEKKQSKESDIQKGASK